jgi:hypothetical protein
VLDFSAASFESLIGIGGSALAFGGLYVLYQPVAARAYRLPIAA